MAEETGQRVKRRLQELNKTARGASIEANLNPDTLGKLISGKTRVPRGDSAARIAQVLDWTLEDLLGSGPTNSLPMNNPASLSIRSDPLPAGFAQDSTMFGMDDGPSSQPEEPSGPNQSRWQVPLNADVPSHFKPGDYFIIDQSVSPLDGDDILVNVANIGKSGGRTMLRGYWNSWAIGGPGSKPLQIDGERVVILGTVIKVWRERTPA